MKKAITTRQLRLVALLLVPIALLLSSLPGPPVEAQRIHRAKPKYHWHKTSSDAGITVYSKDHPDRDLPSFRGVGVVNASIYAVLAVLEDTSRHTEWMERCIESRLVRTVSENRRIVYNRTGAMWPVSDRDVVVDGSMEFDAVKKIVWLRFKSLRKSSVPDVDGVVRMTNLSGHYKLVQQGPNRTHVTFEVDADPGGSLPKFIVKWATRDIPIKTIKALRKQARDMSGRRGELVANWKSRHPFD